MRRASSLGWRAWGPAHPASTEAACLCPTGCGLATASSVMLAHMQAIPGCKNVKRYGAMRRRMGNESGQESK